MENIAFLAKKARSAALTLANTTVEQRNKALQLIADNILKNKEAILEENLKDYMAAKESNLALPLLSRLKLNNEKCNRMAESLIALSKLEDPLGKITYGKTICKGMELYRVSVPMGVVGVIFESRPDALVQIASLCLKSGNATLLKGGAEALYSNKILTRLIQEACEKASIPTTFCQLLTSREEVKEMLALDKYIDLIIPRGSNEFVAYIMKNSNIPVLGHADGICHVYIDETCDLEMAKEIVIDSKTQNLSVCNACETLLIHRNISTEFILSLVKALQENGVEVRGDLTIQKISNCKLATNEDWDTEYLDAIISIAVVDSINDAIKHINQHGSHHTDCIVTNNENNVKLFMQTVDSACVFHNCSTRFSDGFIFGLGAEVGIATGKLHARGPMGLEGLCTYQYRVFGHGETMSELNNGKISLEHASL